MPNSIFKHLYNQTHNAETKAILKKLPSKNNSRIKEFWSVKNNELINSELGNVNLLLNIPDYTILAVIPLNYTHAYILYSSLYKNRKFVYFKDLKYITKKKKWESSISFKFYDTGKKVRSIRSDIKSCRNKNYAMGIGFFFRLLYRHKINCFSSDTFIKAQANKKRRK